MAAAAGGSRRRAPPQRGEPSPGPPLLLGLRGGGDAAAGNAGIRADPGIREGERAGVGRPQRSSPQAAADPAGLSRADPPVRPGIPAGLAPSRGEQPPPLPGAVPLAASSAIRLLIKNRGLVMEGWQGEQRLPALPRGSAELQARAGTPAPSHFGAVKT
nr:basic salivary proline-rich protein 3-like [Taeniopygia guttata]XP_041571328.1 basic salivary proline-rich protein 3-like [Taeniopygia guttata]